MLLPYTNFTQAVPKKVTKNYIHICYFEMHSNLRNQFGLEWLELMSVHGSGNTGTYVHVCKEHRKEKALFSKNNSQGMKSQMTAVVVCITTYVVHYWKVGHSVGICVGSIQKRSSALSHSYTRGSGLPYQRVVTFHTLKVEFRFGISSRTLKPSGTRKFCVTEPLL